MHRKRLKDFKKIKYEDHMSDMAIYYFILSDGRSTQILHLKGKVKGNA